MTRATTWTNPDGLVVGYGPNYPERQEGAVVNTLGSVKEARVYVTYQSTFGAAGAGFTLPVKSLVESVHFEVENAWTSSDSGTLSVGDNSESTNDVDGWITATAMAAAQLTIGKKIAGDGVYAVGDDGGAADTDNKAPAQYRASEYNAATTGCKLYFTKANNFTAGSGWLVIRYI